MSSQKNSLSKDISARDATWDWKQSPDFNLGNLNVKDDENIHSGYTLTINANIM